MQQNDENPKKVLTAVLLGISTYLMSSSGISINLSNNSMNYIQNQTNNYYLNDDKS